MTVRETGRAPVTASVTAPVTASVTAAHIRDKMVHAKGKVERLFVHRDGLSIRLAGTKLKPKHEYFNLPLTHPNYNALFSLASMVFRALFLRSFLFLRISLIRLNSPRDNSPKLEKRLPNDRWVATMREIMKIVERST